MSAQVPRGGHRHPKSNSWGCWNMAIFTWIYHDLARIYPQLMAENGKIMVHEWTFWREPSGWSSSDWALHSLGRGRHTSRIRKALAGHLFFWVDSIPAWPQRDPKMTLRHPGRSVVLGNSSRHLDILSLNSKIWWSWLKHLQIEMNKPAVRPDVSLWLSLWQWTQWTPDVGCWFPLQETMLNLHFGC